MKRLSTLVILTSYLLQIGFAVDTSFAQEVQLSSIPLDEFTAPAFHCLERENISHPPDLTAHPALTNDLQTRCFGLSSSLAALWTLARYQRASLLTKNPSPMVQMARTKLFEILKPATLRQLKAEITDSPIVDIRALTWVLRLDLELHEMDSLTDPYTRSTLRTLSFLAMEKLKLLVKDNPAANRETTFNNSAWIMWNMLTWSLRVGRNADVEMLKVRGRELFGRLDSCNSEPSYDGPVQLSPCFAEITFLIGFYPQQEILDLLTKKFPDPDLLILRAGGGGSFGVAPSILLATTVIQNLVSQVSPWVAVHNVNLRKTLESLPLWREQVEVGQWLAPFTVMAITSELN